MSPIIIDFFIALKSMQNAQALDHTNGLSKYVCKYIGKFDEGNYIILCQDIHTGDWVIGKTHLYNTKIVRSKMNEDRAYQNDRRKYHLKGCDMPYFEICQILLGHPKVYTNINFIEVSSLPFELRPHNAVSLNINGDVIDNSDDLDDHPSDIFVSGPLMQRLRNNLRLLTNQHMTDNQIATYCNHNGSSLNYDMISIFSLRLPELLGVFTNPIDYFRTMLHR